MRKLLFASLLLLGGVARGQGRHKQLFEQASHGKYQPGFYTLADGSRHAGVLRIWQDLARTTLQVAQGQAEPLNLPAAELAGFVIGPDSFAVARQVRWAGPPAGPLFEELAVLKLILRGSVQVWQHDKLVPTACGGALPNGVGGSVPMAGNCTAHVRTWVLRPAPTASLVAIPEGQQEFAQHVAGLFVGYPALCQRIRAGYEGPADFKRIVYAFALRQDIEQVSFERAATIFPDAAGW